MIRVVVADDQALVRTGFRVILDPESDLEVVGEAGDGRETVAVVQGCSASSLRELEVLRLVAGGHSNAEIARHLVPRHARRGTRPFNDRPLSLAARCGL